RRKIIGRLGVEMELAEAGDQTLTIAMVDIDHFKSINDRFGHELGDMTLVKVSQVLEAQLQGREMVGRLGGEEFLLVMPDNDAQQVRDRCLVLADALANLDWNAAGLE
ncbi:MAG TPA: GGDEF domain-containing protein, partial [Erythrobacter sp.]|nr:GGDEF domain-containing protein [Erythrobacter sp.]